ncbi:MFS general substrate transporter [Crucibulum laeve]|uniref:MFS general substrate transporter n=1 Tax=Crucibulum laeve TaxID=68775 RepID=A0A5C3M8C5_9AGAR|nr:MFS general substrate transporter [Crucibulum laeve]
MSLNEKLASSSTNSSATDVSEIDLLSFHEKRAGRLIIDPAEAKIELGERVASKLKLSKDGTKVLWPQPTDDPEDPQNWSDRRKAFQLIIIILTSIVPDMNSAIGIAAIFGLAEQYDTTPGVINNLTSNWSIFLTAWGGLFAVMLMRRYGRLPVLFWSQVAAVAFMAGATFAPTLKVFAAMRCLTGFFGTVPQVTGLYILNFWTMGLVISPFLAPFAFGFLCARASWRWAYGIGTLYDLIVVILIFCFLEETMYDRTVKPIPQRPTTGLRYRAETLIGITGVKMAKYRASWTDAITSPFNVIWRPQIIGILLFETVLFGFGIGVIVTMVVFLSAPPFSFNQDQIAGIYATPIVSVIMGELIGRYLNDWIMNISIRRNNGVFEAQNRLWACYLSALLQMTGFLTLGAALQHHLSVGAIIMGWGIAEVGIMIGTVSVYAYCNDCFPKHQGEISALLTLARILGGFSVAYFQIPWATKNGALQTFGVEAAIVMSVFILVVPFLQIKGASLRARYSI